MLALGAVLMLGTVGCESAVADQRSAATELAPGAPVPQGGTLRVGVLGDVSPRTFLQIGTSPANGHIVANVFDTLIRYGSDDVVPRPALATDWELAPDGRSLALELRRDVTFHDGRPFVSSDVAASLRAYVDGPWTPQFKRTAAAITDFDTADPHRVVLRFAHPVSNVFDLLDSAPILDEHTLPELIEGTVFNGTGPFEFAGWQPKSKVELVGNDDYWDGPPPLDGIDLVLVSDSRSVYSRLRTGQLDVATGLSHHDQQLASGRYGFSDITLTGAEGAVYLGINVEHPALADVRVRRAIALALDRDRIITDVYRGSGYVANLPWPRWSPAYDEAANRTYRRDVEAARALLAEYTADTGTPELPRLPLEHSTIGGYGIVAEIVASNLADIGIETELRPNDSTQNSAKLIAGEFPALWVLEHAFAQYTPSTLAVSAYPFNAAENTSHYRSGPYSAAATEAWQAPGATSPPALDAYRRLSDLLLSDLFLVEIGVTLHKIAAAPSVGGIGWDKRNQLHLRGTYLTSQSGDLQGDD